MRRDCVFCGLSALKNGVLKSVLKISLLIGIFLSLAFCASTQSKKARDNEKDPQYQYEKAVIAMKYELVDAAVGYLNQALSLDPRHCPSYKLLGLVFFRKGDFAEAVSAYQRYVEFCPDSSEAHTNLGIVYQEMGSEGRAEEEYKMSFAIDENPNASFYLAKLYLGQNKLDLALEFIQKSIQKNSTRAGAFNLQGVILNQMGRYPEAIESFQDGQRLAPNDVIIGANLGMAYYNNRDFDNARSVFERALPRIQDESLKNKIQEYLKILKEKF